MGLRDAIRNNPAVSGAVALLIAAVAVWMSMKVLAPRPAPRPSGRQWFYNLSTRELFVADQTAIPPIDAPGGGQAVRARVYGCGGCEDAGKKGIVLESYPPEVARTLAAPLPVDAASTQAEGFIAQRERLAIDAMLIASPPAQPDGAVRWIAIQNPDAAAVVILAEQQCEGQTPRICSPP